MKLPFREAMGKTKPHPEKFPPRSQDLRLSAEPSEGQESQTRDKEKIQPRWGRGRALSTCHSPHPHPTLNPFLLPPSTPCHGQGSHRPTPARHTLPPAPRNTLRGCSQHTQRMQLASVMEATPSQHLHLGCRMPWSLRWVPPPGRARKEGARDPKACPYVNLHTAHGQNLSQVAGAEDRKS